MVGLLAASGVVEKGFTLREAGSALMLAELFFVRQSICRAREQACVRPASPLPGPASKGRLYHRQQVSLRAQT